MKKQLSLPQAASGVQSFIWPEFQEFSAPEVGYIGGHVENPSYEDVCSKKSGHIEAVKVTYDSKKVSFRDLAMIFSKPTITHRKTGKALILDHNMYLEYSLINDDEISVFNELSDYLKNEGHVATKILKPSKFWPAEDYHQNYYEKQGSNPYCHIYREIFPRA